MKNYISRPLRIVLLSLFMLWAAMCPAMNKPLQTLTLIQDTIKAVNVDSSEFILQGIARNGDTGENFDHIYLDVYKILKDGSVEIVRADRFPGGKFEIWLRKHEKYMLMMNYNNRAFLEGLLNPAEANIIDGILNQIFILDEYRPDLKTKEDTAKDYNPAVVNEERTTPSFNSTTTEIVESDVADEKEETIYKASDTHLVENTKPEEELNKSTSSPIEKSAPTAIDELETMGTFQVSESTSFREEATHLSNVILRFSSGDEVALLEKTNQYWWKVSFKEKTGWIKAAKLEQSWF